MLIAAGTLVAGPAEAIGGVLGVSIQDVTPELAEALGIPVEGVIVRQVSPGGPAAKAGIRVGDVIVEVNRKAVKDRNEFVAKLKKIRAGKSVALTIWRYGEGRYFLGARLGEEGSVASPQEDDRPRPPGSESEEPEASDAEPPLVEAPEAGEQREPASEATSNLVRNGGFEEGLVPPWGSGEISEGRPWRVLQGARAYGEGVFAPVHSGQVSLAIRHASEERPGWMGVTSQSLGVLEPGAEYVLEVWARAEDLRTGGVRVRIVLRGTRPGVAKGLRGTGGAAGADALPVAEISVPGGSYDWRRLQTRFEAPPQRLDLEILSVDQGVVYLDDVAVFRAP
jgi:hypothetical protein